MIYPVLAFCLLLFAAPVMAQPAEEPARLVESTFAKAVEIVREQHEAVKGNPDEAYRLIESTLSPHVDFGLTARLVLGRHWKQATPEQQQQFVAVFRESLLRTYAAVLAENIDEIVRRVRTDRPLLEVLPARESPNPSRALVRTRLLLEEGPIAIDYQMRRYDDRWLVFDVAVMNVSLVTNLRAEYDSLLRKHGMQGVIELLSERNRARSVAPVE